MTDDPTRVSPEICHTFGQLLQSLEGGQLDYDLAEAVQHYELERSLDHAIREACEKAAAETELPLLYGRPEGDRT